MYVRYMLYEGCSHLFLLIFLPQNVPVTCVKGRQISSMLKLTTIKCRLRWILKESLVPRASTLGISDMGICRRKIMDSSQNRARQGDDPGIVEIPRNKIKIIFVANFFDLDDHHNLYHASHKNGASRGEYRRRGGKPTYLFFSANWLIAWLSYRCIHRHHPHLLLATY